MTDAIESLIGLAGPELARRENPTDFETNVPTGLRTMYQVKNGFLAFDQSLYVLPSGSHEKPLSAGYWNGDVWRQEYEVDLTDHWFFAQDAFGNQFSVYEEESVFVFDVELGELEFVAPTVEEWATRLLVDPFELTGCVLCRSWQAANGPLPEETRLVPRIPFILGGEYDVANLRPVHSLEAIRFRAALSSQISDLPEGSSVAITFE